MEEKERAECKKVVANGENTLPICQACGTVDGVKIWLYLALVS